MSPFVGDTSRDSKLKKQNRTQKIYIYNREIKDEQSSRIFRSFFKKFKWGEKIFLKRVKE